MWNKETNRPDDWNKVAEGDLQRLNYPYSQSDRTYFEAGANATVEEAKAEGRRELIEELEKNNRQCNPYEYLIFGLLIEKAFWEQLLKENNG